MFRKKLLLIAMASGGLIGLGVGGPAQASVLASSYIEMTNFQILGSDGQPLDFNTDFGGLTFTSSADVDVKLGGATAGDEVTGATSPIDITQQSIGTAPLAENVFAPVSSAGGEPTGNYSFGDQLEAGAPIANVPCTGSSCTDPTFDLGATVANSAYVGIETGSTAGSATSNNGLSSSWTFTLTQDTGITFEFDAEAYLEAFVTGDEVFPSVAEASYSFFFKLVNQATGVTIFEWTPDGAAGGITGGTENSDPFDLNTLVSLNAPTFAGWDIATCVPDSNADPLLGCGVANSGSFSATTVQLLRFFPGTTTPIPYQLTARIETVADAARVAVPEPSALALMGIGLLGIGAARIRRRYA